MKNNGLYTFGPFQLNKLDRRLTRQGELIPLARKAFDLLILLIEAEGRLVTRSTLIEALWPRSVVQEQNLNSQMHGLRKALGDDGGEAIFIETVRGIGYRFIAPIETGEHELQDGHRQVRWFVAGGLAVAALLTVATIFVLGRLDSGSAVLERQKIAVLPFRSLSLNPGDESLARAIADEISTRLTTIHALKVIAPASVTSRSGTPPNLAAVGKQLGVSTVLTGTVQLAKASALINIRLVDVRSGVALWAGSYTRRSSDILNLEVEIAESVVEALDTRESEAERTHIKALPTRNSVAYDAYLRGIAYTARAANSRANYERADEYFLRAVQLDPGFAHAWARLTMAHVNLYYFGYDRSEARLAKIKAALQTTRRLAPNDGETWLAVGEYRAAALADMTGGLQAFEEAKKRLPDSALVFREISYVLRALGRWREAMTYEKKAAELDPRNARAMYQWALSHIANREFGKARTILNKALDISPDDPELIARLASTFQAEGDLVSASKVLKPLPLKYDNIHVFSVQVDQMIFEGRFREAAKSLRDAIDRWRPSKDDTVGYDYLLLGETLRLSGEPSAARIVYKEGRARVSRLRQAGDDSFWTLANLSDIDAYLGDAAKAIEEAREARSMIADNTVYGPSMAENLAFVEHILGHDEQAIDLLKDVLHKPYGNFMDALPLTVKMLQIDPRWRTLRKDPGFRALLVK